MLRSLILKPKSLKLLILTLFLSTTRDVSLSLTLLYSGQLLDILSNSENLLVLNFVLVGIFLASYIIFSLVSSSSRLIARRQLRIMLRDCIFDFVVNSPSPLEISGEKSLGYLKNVEEKIFKGVNSLLNFLTALLGIIINIIIFNIYNFIVALIALPIIFSFVLMPLLISGLQEKLGKKAAQIAGEKSSKFLNLIDSFSVLSIFESKTALPSLYKRKMAQLNRKSWIIEAKLSIIAHITALFFYIFYTIVNLVVGYFVSISLLGYGAFLVVNSLGTKLLDNGRALVSDLQAFQQIRGMLKEVTPQKRKVQEINVFESITIKDLIFNHKNNEQPLYDHLNLKFEVGKKYALVGPSGCGKSTLALILLKLLDPPSESIFWSNINYENLHFEEIIKEGTLISGKFPIFNASFKENLTLETNIEDSKIIEIVNLLGLNDIPLDRQIDKDSISTGQRQRILIGRALLRNYKLLILDEALANIDKKNAKRILEKLLNDKNLTLIHITHHLKSVENYDQVIRLGGKND